MTMRSTEHMSRCAKCRYYCRTGATFLFSHIGLCGLVFGYTVMGAFTFELLEADNEYSKRQNMVQETQKVVDSLWDLTAGSQVLNESKWSENATVILSSYEKKLVQAMRKEGFDGNFNETASPQWSFSGALLYSIIVITTIGYGNIAPKTDTGKIVTILYAIIGIPLLLLCLSNIGDAMAHSFKFIYWKVCCYLCTTPKSHHHRRNRAGRSSVYDSDMRSSALQAAAASGQYGTLERRVYGVPSAHYETQRSYRSTDSGQHSLPRSHHSFNAREAGVADAMKVPVISNRYVLNLADSQVNHLHRHSALSRMNTLDSGSYHHPSSPLIRNPPRLQDPMSSTFMPVGDEIDFDDLQSLSTDRDEDDDSEEASVPIMLCILIVVGYICGGAILFSYWEKWEYSDSCYFCFITLTTIGFGDMVPGTAVLSEDAQLALGLCSLYLLFGMALLAMSFNLVQEEVTKSVTSIGKRIGILSDDDDDYDDI